MIRSAAANLGRTAGQLFAPANPVLPPYREERRPIRRFVAKALFTGLCVFLGIFYGFSFAVFPPILIIYSVIPILLLAMVVIWALPDRGTAPTRLLRRLFFAYLLFLIMWPAYVSIQLPGMPWISFRRLIGFPTVLVLLVCISTSHKFRAQLRETMDALPVLWRMVALFVLVEFVTIFTSAAPFVSLNLFIDRLILEFGMFFVGLWVLSQPGMARRWARTVIGMAIALCFIGLLESHNQQILWAQHIPSFLTITDPSVQQTLTAVFRSGSYRVTTTFSVSLAFAEYLSIAVPFLLHWLMNRPGLQAKAALIALDLLVLTAIVLTQARLGIVGWLIAHGAYGCLWAFRRWRHSRLDLIGPAVAIVYPVGLLLFLVAMFTVDAVKFRTIGGGSTGFSDMARTQQFQLFWPRLFHNPFGYGLGRAGEVLGFRSPGGQLTVDSYIITIGLNFGIAGLALYFGMIGYAIWKMCQLALRSGEGEESLAMPLAAALSAFLVIRCVLAQEDNASLLYMMLAMTSALMLRAQRAAQPAPAVQAHRYPEAWPRQPTTA